MIAKSTPRLPWNGDNRLKQGSVFADAPPGPPSLLSVLWSRRRTLVLTMLACPLCALAYLLVAKPVFNSSATLLVEPNGPKAYSENQGVVISSDTFLQKQAAVLQSTPILTRALLAVHYPQLKTFARVTGNPTEWLRRDSAFNVQADRKDVIVVSMESRYPQEAADLVNAVVDAYVADQSQRKLASGAAMIASLRQEKQEIDRKRDAKLSAMVAFKQEHGTLSFRDDKGNIVLERLAAVSNALTTAELAAMSLQAQIVSAKAMLASPASISAFVVAQQNKQNERGDKEYDDLRSQLQLHLLTLTELSSVMGENNTRIRLLRIAIDVLQQKIAAKERTIAEAHLAELSTHLTAAEEEAGRLQQKLKEQQQQAFGMNPQAVQYAKLEADMDRLQKQSDLLDGRIEEITVNSRDAGPLTVEVIDPARPEETPIKPKKALILAASLLVGALLSIGLVMFQEQRDTRLRSPEDVIGSLGVGVLGSVPRMPAELSPVERGQIVGLDPMSEAGEAYRVIRTSIRFGAGSEAKTILVTSPTAGDGKSTTASNLAIALAQAGCRTLLIDCNLRQPAQHGTFELPVGRAGLTDAMAGREELQDVIYETAIDRLYLLPCGALPANPSELLGGKGFDQVIEGLTVMFDRIVIDSAPLVALPDARILAASVDLTLLVVRMNHSQRKFAAAALECLHEVGANVVGVIANDLPQESFPGRSRYIGAGSKPGLNGATNSEHEAPSGPQLESRGHYELPADILASSNGDDLSPREPLGKS